MQSHAKKYAFKIIDRYPKLACSMPLYALWLFHGKTVKIQL